MQMHGRSNDPPMSSRQVVTGLPGKTNVLLMLLICWYRGGGESKDGGISYRIARRQEELLTRCIPRGIDQILHLLKWFRLWT